MNTIIQSQVDFELTDEQLANISGGFDHDDHHDRGDDDDRHGRRGHCHPHWVWNQWRRRWEWVPECWR